MDSTTTSRLLRRAKEGDGRALDELFRRHRKYLKRVVELRMDPVLRTRVDPSDIVQETHVTAMHRLDDFFQRRPSSFKLWLRAQAVQQLVDQYRRHIHAERRSVSRECALSDASSIYLARHVVSGGPSEAFRRKELASEVRRIVNELSPQDREMVLLRFVEELSNAEAAEVIGIEPETARKRHGRALRRLFEKLLERGIVHPS